MIAQALRAAPLSTALHDPHVWPLLGRTVFLSVGVAVAATLLGSVAGCLLGTTEWRGKSLARIVLILPLAIPPYLHAIGWTTLFRPRGLAVRSLEFLFGISASSISEAFYSFAGATVVLSLAYSPIAMLFCEKSLALSSPSLVEAAKVLGANRRQTFLVARWPFLRPAVASSAMIVFLLAASDLGVPTILKIKVFNFEVFTQLGAFNDVTTATLLALPLLGVGLAVLTAERRLTVGAMPETDDPDVEPPRPATARQTRLNRTFFAALAVVAIVLPMGAIIATAADLDALAHMYEAARKPAGHTIRYAVAASVLITLVAFGLAWILRNAGRYLSRLTDWILVIGFAVPSTIVALALLGIYNRPGLSRVVTPATLVVAALVVRYAIIGHRIAGAAVVQVPDSILEAAALDGAGPLRTLWHILLPLTRVALAATLAVTFVLTVGEIGSTILLHPPGGETLPIALYQIEANSPRSYVAAMTLLQLLLILVPLAAIPLIVRRARR